MGVVRSLTLELTRQLVSVELGQDNTGGPRKVDRKIIALIAQKKLKNAVMARCFLVE